MSERMRKLLEIKAEMERETEMKKNRLQNIRVAREQRHQQREVKQKLRKRERPSKAGKLKIRLQSTESISPSASDTPQKIGARIQETKPQSPTWDKMPGIKPFLFDTLLQCFFKNFNARTTFLRPRLHFNVFTKY